MSPKEIDAIAATYPERDRAAVRCWLTLTGLPPPWARGRQTRIKRPDKGNYDGLTDEQVAKQEAEPVPIKVNELVTRLTTQRGCGGGRHRPSYSYKGDDDPGQQNALRNWEDAA